MKRDRPSDIGLLLLRMILFTLVAYYGSQKLFGTFGGPGLASSITEIRNKFHVTPETAQAILITEFACALAVLIGFLTRLAALACAATTAMTVYSFGVASNYKDAQMPLVLSMIALALVCTGSGRASVDWMMVRGRKRSAKTSGA